MKHLLLLSGLLTLIGISCKPVAPAVPAVAAGVSTFIDKAEFNKQLGYEIYPQSITIDGSNNLYVADLKQIYKITPSGKISLYAGGNQTDKNYRNRPALQTYFEGISAIAIDASGAVYVAESEGHFIRRISAGGIVNLFAARPNWYAYQDVIGTDDGPDTLAHIGNPLGLAIDPSGNVYETEAGSINGFSTAAIRRITTDGYVRTVAGRVGRVNSGNLTAAPNFSTPVGITMGDANTVYVSDTRTGVIARVTSDGLVTTLAGSGRLGTADGIGQQASFKYPRSLAYGRNKILYVGDYATIRQVLPNGQVSTLAGDPQGNTQPVSMDGSLSAARFGYIAGIAVNSVGDLYVVDAGNGSIRRVRLNS